MADKSNEMSIENLQDLASLKLKIENQAKVIKELTLENEELYHQYNHLIIRNGKLLKRIDDFQKIIDDLHIRNEELLLINGNMMQINDRIRRRNDLSFSQEEKNHSSQEKSTLDIANEKIESEFDLEDLYDRWKKYPGQVAHNAPNLRKQVLMLIHLYRTSSLRAAELFSLTGIGGVTGARYISTLKKFGLILFSGARKKGYYEITKKGIDFIENSVSANIKSTSLNRVSLIPGPSSTESIKENENLSIKH